MYMELCYILYLIDMPRWSCYSSTANKVTLMEGGGREGEGGRRRRRRRRRDEEGGTGSIVIGEELGRVLRVEFDSVSEIGRAQLNPSLLRAPTRTHDQIH
jgi:hypothetical protein